MIRVLDGKRRYSSLTNASPTPFTHFIIPVGNGANNGLCSKSSNIWPCLNSHLPSQHLLLYADDSAILVTGKDRLQIEQELSKNTLVYQ